MDPVSAIGVGAATLQLVDRTVTTLFGIIKLIRNLRDIPQRLEILLGDVEKAVHRVNSLQSALQDPTSRIVSQLQVSQAAALQALVHDARSAITDVYQKLQLVFGPQAQTGTKLKRAWRAVVSIEFEKELERKLERIQRINDELTRQLQVASVEIQADLGLRVVDMAQTTQLLKADMERLCISGDAAHEVTRTAVRSALQEHQVATQSSLTELRDAVVTLATGERSALEPAQATAVVDLSPQGREQLARQICETLMTYPSALSQSCDNVVSGISRASRPRYTTAAFGPNAMTCSCRPSWFRSFQRYGFVRINHEARASHWPNCRFTKSAKRSSKYTISVQLLPLLEKTVAMVFDASFQGGGVSFAPTLKTFTTVKRDESPLFNLFDDFPSLCARRYYEDQHGPRPIHITGPMIQDESEGGPFYFDWDMKAVRVQLRVLVQRILSLVMEHGAALDAKDETGRTLLHEITQLICYLGPQHADVLPEIQSLLSLAGQVSLDLSATGSMRSGKRHELRVRNLCTQRKGRERDGTAQDIVALLAFSNLISSNFPFSEYFDKFNLDYASYEVYEPQDEGWHYSYHVKSHLRIQEFYKSYPDLLEVQGPLESAIRRRSLMDLELLLELGVDKSRWTDRIIKPLELSLDWIPGLNALLAAEVTDRSYALGLALLLNNLSAVEVLLSNMVDPFEYPVLECALLANDDAQTLIIDEIIKRRAGLRDIASEWLVPKDQIELGIDPNKPLDSNALIVYQRLSSNDINVPASLDPHNHSVWAIYTNDIVTINNPAQATAFFEKLLESGFQDFDTPVSSDCGHTPLMMYVQWFISSPQDERCLEIIIWLLNKGASFCVNPENVWPPSILYYAALAFGKGLNPDGQVKKHLSEFARLSATLCDPLQTDLCNCFCSEHGCLPTSIFLACEKRPRSFTWHDHCPWIARPILDRKLFAWIDCLNLDKAQRTIYLNHDARLEVFQRLGLAHTCCSRVFDEDQELQDEDEELKELKYEDSELKEQLDLIMEAFRRFQSSFTGSELDLLSQWWTRLDAILPGLQPKDRCRWVLDNSEDSEDLQASRAHLSAETLLASRYDGMDFTEVVKLHFREYLSNVN